MAEATSVADNSDDDQGASWRAVLGNRFFLYLWIAQILSQIAQNTISFVLIPQVGQLTEGSGSATAGVIIAFTVPAVLFSAAAGVFVDRASKKRVLVITNAIRAVVVLAYVLAVAIPRLDAVYALPLLYATTLAFSAVSQFFIPAEASTIPLLVRHDELVAANALFNFTLTLAQLLGFVVIGPVVVLLLPYWAIYVIFFCFYAVCAFLTWRLPDREIRRTRTASGRLVVNPGVRAEIRQAYGEFREGWAFIRTDRGLMTAILYWSVAISVLFMLATIGPPFLNTVLHVDPEHLYFLMVPGGVGLVLGVVLVGRFSTEENRLAMMNISLFAAGVGLLILGLAHDTLNWIAGLLGQPAPPTFVSQLIMGVVTLFLGMLNSFISVPAQTLLQERAPEDVRARVFSAFYTVSNAILIVPLVLAGGLTDLIGVVQTVVLIAALVMLIAGVGLLRARRQPDHLPMPAPPAPRPIMDSEMLDSVVPGNPPPAVGRVSQEPANKTPSNPPGP